MRKGILVLMMCGLIWAITGCVSIPTGDGGSLKISKDGLKVKTSEGEEATIQVDRGKDGISLKGTGPDGVEGSIQIDTKDGGIVYSGKDQDGNVTDGKVSLNNELPADFPKDIPIPDEAQVKAAIVNDTKEGKQFIISLLIEKGEVIDYYNFYRSYADQLKGVTITDGSQGQAKADTVTENMSIAYENGHLLVIGIQKTGTGKFDKGEVGINLMYSMKNAD